MAVKTTNETMGFVITERDIHVGTQQGQRFGLAKANIGRINSGQIAQEIAENTTLSKAEAKFALAASMEVMAKYICMGYKVDLEDFGIFDAKISSAFTANIADVKVEMIREIGMKFLPYKAMRERLRNVHRTMLHRHSQNVNVNEQESNTEND